MVKEIQPHDIGMTLYDINIATLTKAKKRWRRAYFTIYFSNTIARNVISKALLVSEIPKYSAIDIDVKEVSNHFYDVDQTQLVNIVQNKDLEALHRFDGVKGLAKALHTHLQNGIDGQDLNERATVFGSNKPSPKGLFYFVAEAFKDVTILILMGCVVLSLVFGIKEDGIKDGWYEGGSILLAVFLVIVVSAVSNLRQEELQYDSLSKISNINIKMDVVREGRRQKISIFDIVVGDVVVLNVGDQIPADGLFVDGHLLLISMTGESEQIDVNATSNPFLISGAKVVDGYCRMLVLSAGMMSSIPGDINEQTPIQVNSVIRIIVVTVTFVGVIATMLISYSTGNAKDKNDDSVTGIFSAVVAILVVAIPEHLPLVVTLTFSYSMKKMMHIEYEMHELGQEECEEKMVVGTSDNVELSIETPTTDEAEHSSDIVIPEDVSAVLMSVLCVYNNIQQFIQFHLTVNAAAVFINIISDVSLTAVHLLRVNLIMDTLGALVLSTKKKPLVTNIMWKYLFAQAIFQITVLLMFEFKGKEIFNVKERVKNIITFSTFVLCQVLNEFNSRKLKRRNIFEGIHKSKLFFGTMIAITIMIVMVKFLNETKRSNCLQWGISIAIAALSCQSQREDAWNSKNDFVTTVESIKKKDESESIKHVMETLRSGDGRVLHVFKEAFTKAGYRLSRMGVDFDPHARGIASTPEQVVDASYVTVDVIEDFNTVTGVYGT